MKEPGKTKAAVAAALAGLPESAPPAPLPPERNRQKPRKGRGAGDVVTVTVKLRKDEWRRLKMKALADNSSLQEMIEAALSQALTAEGGAPLRSHRVDG